MGLKTKFFSTTELVLKLAEARKQGTLEKLVKDLQKQDLLILDEWGYVPVTETAHRCCSALSQTATSARASS